MTPDTNEEPRKNAEGTRGRPFEKGNPGRPKGSRNKATRIAEQLLDGETEAVIRKAIDLAMQGDGPILRTLLGLVAPQQRGRMMQLDLPVLHKAEDALAAIESARAALSQGEITESELKAITGFVEQFLKAVDVVDLSARLEAIAEKIGLEK